MNKQQVLLQTSLSYTTPTMSEMSSTVSIFSKDPAMQAAILAATLSCLVVLSSVGAYIQYTHAMEFADKAAHTKVNQYMAIAAILMLVGLVLAPLVCFQAGVWSTRTGVPRATGAMELAFMPPLHVIAFYVSIGLMVLINTLLSLKAHNSFIVSYEEEETPLFENTIKWDWIAHYMSYAMGIMAVAAVVMTYMIVVFVNKAAANHNIDMPTGIALSLIRPAAEEQIRATYR